MKRHIKLEVGPVKQLISLPAASQKLTQRNCQLSALKLLLESSPSAPSPTTTIEARKKGEDARMANFTENLNSAALSFLLRTISQRGWWFKPIFYSQTKMLISNIEPVWLRVNLTPPNLGTFTCATRRPFARKTCVWPWHGLALHI